MTDDLISRQKAIDATWKDTGYTDPFNVMTAIRDRLKQLPSAQPEIVKCKDCKYWNSGYCECPEPVINTEAEHFCGYADKKEVTTWAKSN